MKLVHPELTKQIIFTENVVNVITIENKAFFVKLIQDLILQIRGEDGEFILSEKNADLDISKICELITDPFNLDINSKKNLNKIYTSLKSLSTDEHNYLSTAKTKQQILHYIDTLIFNYDLPLTYNGDLDLTMLFKSMNIQIDNEASNLLDQIVHYLSVSVELDTATCFIFINLKQFLTYDECARLYKFCSYKKINLLLFETCYTEQNHACEEQYIIDNDLCEIY